VRKSLPPALFFFSLIAAPLAAQRSLTTVPIPLPGNLDTFVKNRPAAIRLGTALFWDEQTGGDGRVACATCHFKAGVDDRTVNTINPGPNGAFDGVPSPGGTLTAAHFPIRNDNIVGSQGVVRADFIALDPGNPLAADQCSLVDDGVFFPNRQVTGRNVPSTIMAIFNRDNFWDGRAKREFNGVTPAGNVTPLPTILIDNGNGPVATSVILSPASAASQAVGPPNNQVEMSCAGRTFPLLGRKLLGRQPLALQVVADDDSVLGSLSQEPGTGLSTTYPDMVRAAFQDNLHSAGASQMEANFSFFWGVAVMLYESTLIPNQTPFDRFAAGNSSAMTSAQRAGLAVFNDQGRCDHCHGGATFTGAAIVGGEGDSFANTGVTPTAADGGRQPENKGKFKTPTLRNVELTGPYFHNGRYLTLRQVVEFYNRGGDVRNEDMSSQIRPLGLSSTQKANLVEFMLALTDERVRFERAPFDHPSLNPPNFGAVGPVGAGGRATPIRTFLNANPRAQ
jgi:cytochrome c peroxidase